MTQKLIGYTIIFRDEPLCIRKDCSESDDDGIHEQTYLDDSGGPYLVCSESGCKSMLESLYRGSHYIDYESSCDIPDWIDGALLSKIRKLSKDLDPLLLIMLLKIEPVYIGEPDEEI